MPDHLCGVFRNLEKYGHALKMEHGQGFKRRIKYDDGQLSLYMDAILPGANQDWYRIFPEEAAANTRGRVGSSTSDGTRGSTSSQVYSN